MIYSLVEMTTDSLLQYGKKSSFSYEDSLLALFLPNYTVVTRNNF